MVRILIALLLGLAVSANAQNHEDTVHAVKAQLVANGVALSGPCGAFQITKRVAWLLRAEGYGLLAKGGNNCEGYSPDVVILPSGIHYDILINSETQNIPAWQLVRDQNDPTKPYLRPLDYRAPFDPDPIVLPPPPTLPPSVPPTLPPPPEPPASNGQLDRIEDKLDKHIESTEEFQKNVGSEWRAVKSFLKDKGLYILGAVLSGKFIWGS